jgi:hypothetical protein
MATGTYDRRPTTAPRRRIPPRRGARRSVERPRRTMAIPRTRGLLGGLVLVALGVWGGLIPFVGPYFGYEFGSDQTWAMSWNRLWLDVLPGAVLVLGGLMLMASRNRISGIIGGWIALCGGAWFVVGPTVATLWDGADPIGPPIGSNLVQVLEQLGYFYALGALAIAFAGMALGRMSVVAVRDVEIAEARRQPVTDTEPAAEDGVAEEPAPTRRTRLLRRTR